jgi:hypothetical protein
VAHRAFTFGSAGNEAMVWKKSVDLSRAVVPAMGHHDPLDGLVTCLQLEATAAQLDDAPANDPALADAVANFAGMVDPEALVTDDPLGIGGLLADAFRLSQVSPGDPLVSTLLGAATRGLERFATTGAWRAPARHRLAFRELGLAVGLAGVAMLARTPAPGLDAPARARLDELAEWAPLRDEIEMLWLAPEHRRGPSWLEHENINDVMLATALVPEGFLVLAPPAHAA